MKICKLIAYVFISIRYVRYLVMIVLDCNAYASVKYFSQGIVVMLL